MTHEILTKRIEGQDKTSDVKNQTNLQIVSKALETSNLQEIVTKELKTKLWEKGHH